MSNRVTLKIEGERAGCIRLDDPADAAYLSPEELRFIARGPTMHRLLMKTAQAKRAVLLRLRVHSGGEVLEWAGMGLIKPWGFDQDDSLVWAIKEAHSRRLSPLRRR